MALPSALNALLLSSPCRMGNCPHALYILLLAASSVFTYWASEPCFSMVFISTPSSAPSIRNTFLPATPWDFLSSVKSWALCSLSSLSLKMNTVLAMKSFSRSYRDFVERAASIFKSFKTESYKATGYSLSESPQ